MVVVKVVGIGEVVNLLKLLTFLQLVKMANHFLFSLFNTLKFKINERTLGPLVS